MTGARSVWFAVRLSSTSHVLVHVPVQPGRGSQTSSPSLRPAGCSPFLSRGLLHVGGRLVLVVLVVLFVLVVLRLLGHILHGELLEVDGGAFPRRALTAFSSAFTQQSISTVLVRTQALPILLLPPRPKGKL